MARTRSSATWLALAYAALIVYASLYPATGWRLPRGGLPPVLALPWPAWFPSFDIVSNVLGYLPLGALLCVAAVRGGAGRIAALALAVALAATLSYALEVVQQWTPARVPTLLDFTLNVAGALLGALLALAVHALGGLERWQTLRDRLFVRSSAGAIALLLLWPVGLLFPPPVPLGLGQVWDEARAFALALLDGTPWADAAVPFLAPAGAGRPLSRLGEALAIALGLLAPCLVAYAVAHPGWQRVGLDVGAAVVAIATTALSTALNFGPENALAWWTSATGPGLAGGLALALLCAAAPRRLAAGLGLVALTALMAVVATAPADPYHALSLQAWQQGRFIRFHGLAQWVGWLWPYVAMAWLLSRLGRPDAG
ncbi:MAG: VanZ family protein [Burkholderiaceae bacterium]|nr:VanZ family protein [Burkholderiaceae bacterium]